MFIALSKCIADDRLECVGRGAALTDATVLLLFEAIRCKAMACESRRMARRGADQDQLDILEASAEFDSVMSSSITSVVEAFIERDTVERGVWDDESFLAVRFPPPPFPPVQMLIRTRYNVLTMLTETVRRVCTPFSLFSNFHSTNRVRPSYPLLHVAMYFPHTARCRYTFQSLKHSTRRCFTRMLPTVIAKLLFHCTAPSSSLLVQRRLGTRSDFEALFCQASLRTVPHCCRF